MIKYLLLLAFLTSCVADDMPPCTMTKRKALKKSLLKLYTCNGTVICRIEGDKDVDCFKEMEKDD